MCMLSHVLLFSVSWTVACQTLSMEFPRQEYWSGLPFLSPGDQTQGSNPCLLSLLHWQADFFFFFFFTTVPPGKLKKEASLPQLWVSVSSSIQEKEIGVKTQPMTGSNTYSVQQVSNIHHNRE